MDTQKKSLALAKLMGWNVIDYGEMVRDFSGDFVSLYGKISCPLMPYSSTEEGRAQFATILLAHSGELITNVAHSISYHKYTDPTQEQLLDEILRMNGAIE